MYYLFLIGAVLGTIGLLWWTFSAMRQGAVWIALVLLLPGLGLLMFAYRHFRYARVPLLLTVIGGGIVGGAVYALGPDTLVERLNGTRVAIQTSYQEFQDARNATPAAEVVEVEPEPEPAPEPPKPTAPVIKDDPLMKDFAQQMKTGYDEIPMSRMKDYPGRMMRVTLNDESQRELRFVSQDGIRFNFSKAIPGGAVSVAYENHEIKKVELVGR